MRGSTPSRAEKSGSIRTEKIVFVVTQICDIAAQSRNDSAHNRWALALLHPLALVVHREKSPTARADFTLMQPLGVAVIFQPMRLK